MDASEKLSLVGEMSRYADERVEVGVTGRFVVQRES